MDPSRPIGLGRIFVFWLPLAATWLMMAIEGPYLAAIIARLADPKHNLAAYGVAFAIAIIIEAPVIMILSAATALADGKDAFRKLRNFTYLLNVSITVVMLLLLLTPAFDFLALQVIGLPPLVGGLTRGALLLLLPWPAAIGYRRFYQGVLIRANMTRRVAYGTVVRLFGMSLTGMSLALLSDWPGAYVGGAALSVGVCLEALATRLMARRAVREVCAVTPAAEEPLSYGRIARFYYPLALTSTISLAVSPMVTFFMGHARQPLESLAVLPVVLSLTFVFRSLGLSYQEVAIALLGKRGQNLAPTIRFAALLALASTLGLAAIAFTPLATLWFRVASGLSEELTAFALTPTRILVVVPALTVLLSLQRAILVQGRRTVPVTWAAMVEVGGILVILLLTVHHFGLVGATAAAIALVLGRVACISSLVPSCSRALERMRPVEAAQG